MTSPADDSLSLQAVCLCAAWCGVCREYEPQFKELAARYPDISWRWVDVEDKADLVEDLDVENFPTIVLGLGGQPVFFGTVLPHIHTLERMVQSASDMKPLTGPDAAALKNLLKHLS